MADNEIIVVVCGCGNSDSILRDEVLRNPSGFHRCKNLVTRDGNRLQCGKVHPYSEIIAHVDEHGVCDLRPSEENPQMLLGK